MSTNKMREALEQLIACHNEPECPAIAVAQAALAADDAVRGTMREQFEAWWQDAGPCMNVTGAEALMIWQASRAAAPQTSAMYAADDLLRSGLDAYNAAQGTAIDRVAAAIRTGLSELDALRARCEAADALLRESLMICEDCGIDDMVIAIDAHLKGAGK